MVCQTIQKDVDVGYHRTNWTTNTDIEVNPLILNKDEDKKRFDKGESRMMNRLKEAGRIPR